MLPAQRNKVDISKLTAAEQQAFRLYGKLPSRPVAKSQERKYFDSGDWALSKAGKQKGEYGKEIPTPDAIPHASPSPQVGSGAGSGGSGTPSGVMSPGSLGMMSPSGSSMGGIGASSSPPGSFVIGNTGGTSPTGSSGLGQNNSNAPLASPPAPGAVPISGASAAASAVSLSMSPGRVGIGGSMGGPISATSIPGLATSPTRSFGSFPIAHAHNSSIHHNSYSSTSTSPTGSGPSLSSSVGVGIPIGNHTSLSPPSGLSAGGLTGGLTGSSPHISATTGNQFGKTQIRRSSQSDGSNSTPEVGSILPAVNASSNMGYTDGPASPPPRSALANSITPDSLMEDENAQAGRGEDEQVEGMELQ